MTRKDFIPTPPPDINEIVEAFNQRIADGGDDHGLIALKMRLVNAKPLQLGLLGESAVTKRRNVL